MTVAQVEYNPESENNVSEFGLCERWRKHNKSFESAASLENGLPSYRNKRGIEQLLNSIREM